MTKRRLIGCVLLLLALAAPLAAGEEVGAGRAALERAAKILDALARDPDAPAAGAAAELSKLGPSAGPALLDLAERYLDRRQVEAAASALAAAAPGDLEEYLLRVASGPGDEPGRTVAWAELGERGSEAAVARVVAGLRGNHGYMKASAERALVKLLRRHGNRPTFVGVARALPGLDEESRARAICCLGETGSPWALEVLLDLVGRWSRLDHAVVAAIARMRGVLPPGEVAPRLLDLLESEDVGVRRETVTALGVFGHSETVETLIGLLGEERGGIGGNALWALQNVSGLKFPGEPARWELWFGGEKAWWEAAGARLLAALETGEPEEILEALSEVSRHPVFLDRFEAALAVLLDHPDPRVRARAAMLLGKAPPEEPGEAASLTENLQAYGFRPVKVLPPAEPAPAADEPPREPARLPLLPIAGIAVLLGLLLRIFGLQLLDRLGEMWRAAGRERSGTMVVKLKGRARTAQRDREKAGAGASQGPGSSAPEIRSAG